MKPYIPKDDNEYPDYYGFTINYVTGKKDSFEVAMHQLNRDTGILEFWTKDDECYWIEMQNVLSISFDKAFSKVIAINNRKEREAKKALMIKEEEPAHSEEVEAQKEKEIVV